MRKTLLALAAAGAASFATADANTIVADTVIEFFDSGAGPIAGPFGGGPGTVGNFEAVPLTNATDGDEATWLSLPTGSFITLGFSNGGVFDGEGDDLFIGEIGAASETAEVYVSTDFGQTFTLLGIANGATVSEFDLAGIGIMGVVNAVRIVGLDALGSSPGFDLTFVEGLEGSVVFDAVPVPAAAALFVPVLLGGAALRRRRA